VTLRAFVACLVLACLAVGCRPAPTMRPGSTTHRVVGVDFEGVEAMPRAELREVLATRLNTANPFVAPSVYNRFEVASDVQRIEAHYASRGYFDARVTGYDVDLDPSGKHGQARIVFEIDEGPQSSLARDANYDTGPLRGLPDLAALISSTPLRAGRPYDQRVVEAERDRLRRELQERSYARASVEARVYANPSNHTVQVAYFFDPGTSCVFGEVRVEGNVHVPDGLVRETAALRSGRIYEHSRLRNAQVELYALDAFTSVEVRPLLAARNAATAVPDGAFAAVDAAMAADGFVTVAHLRDPAATFAATASLLDGLDDIAADDPRVDILITVVEAAEAAYKAGGGLALESSRTEAYTRANATWRNVLSPLNRAELEGRLGYAWLPSVFDREPLARGVVGAVSAGLTRPRVVFGIFDATLRVGFRHGVEPDHAYSAPTARLGIENQINAYTRFTAGYGIALNITRDFAIGEVDGGSLDATRRSSCDELPRSFRIGNFDAALMRERTNFDADARWRRRGASRHDWAGSLKGQLGEGAIGDYPYLRVEPDLRYYLRVGRSLTLATRGAVGAIVDFGEPVPRSQCLFLGGGATLRGFGERRAGPHAEPDIPRGGVMSYLWNLEPRLKLSDLFGLVAFLDAGQVNERIGFDATFGGPVGIHVATGGGLRVFTPIGSVRADVGVRLTGVPASFGRARPFQFVVSLGEAF